jgi:hypothetical protein
VDGVKEVVNNMSVAGVAVAPTVIAPGSTQPQPATPAQLAAQGQPVPPPNGSAAPPPQPAERDLRVPPGTAIPIRITEALDSGFTQTGTPFNGVVTHAIVVDGLVAIPAGSPASGRVIEAKDATHFKGSSELSIKLNAVRIRGNLVSLDTEPYTLIGKGRGQNTAEKVGGAVQRSALALEQVVVPSCRVQHAVNKCALPPKASSGSERMLRSACVRRSSPDSKQRRCAKRNTRPGGSTLT